MIDNQINKIMHELFSKSLLLEPSTDLHRLMLDRLIFFVGIYVLIGIFIHIRDRLKLDKSERTFNMTAYLLFIVFVSFLTVDSAKAFTISSKPSPILLQISDKISVEGDRVSIEPIKDEYPTYRYKGRLKETNVIRLTLKENDMNPEEESKLIDWKSDKYSLSKEEYEMLKAKIRS